MTQSKNDPHEYIGNLHIHSSYSDGAGTVSEIGDAAKRAGLDFIILTEHDYMTDGLHLEEEGFHEGVLVLKGLEIGRRHHHYLAFNLREMVHSAASPQEVIDTVNAQGGFGFLAHPFEKGMSFHEKSVAYTWEDLTVKGFRGICIWNFTSRWKERVRGPFHGLFFLLFKSQTLKGPSRETLAFWDRLCLTRKVAAIGGSDAHGSDFTWGGVRFVPLTYDFVLNSINVHLPAEEPFPRDTDSARESVYAALRAGKLFIAHDNLFPAKGFRFRFKSNTGVELGTGEEAAFEPGRLWISVPAHGRIRLMRDGRPAGVWHNSEAFFRVEEKGVYRVEVYRRLRLFGWRPWIFSNPIYLR